MTLAGSEAVTCSGFLLALAVLAKCKFEQEALEPLSANESPSAAQ